jgi:DNA invertase Pin-like site-specific DNA recombinase
MLIGYSRVSTASQDHAHQIDALEKAGCEKIFIETATGTKFERGAELVKALEFARAGDVICVYRLDRLSRNVRKLLDIVDEITRRGIGLKSLTESIDTETPTGRFSVNLFASLAQLTAEETKMRAAAGRAAAIARGRSGGRPRALDDAKLRIARSLWADPNLSVSDVAKSVSVAPSTLYRTLGSRTALVNEEQAAHAPSDQMGAAA